jgi:hypothetical protein
MQNAPRSGAFLLGKIFCAQNIKHCAKKDARAKISKGCAKKEQQ